MYLCFFFFNDTATTEIYTLSLHDALPILAVCSGTRKRSGCGGSPLSSDDTPVCRVIGATATPAETRPVTSSAVNGRPRSEEHTSELQSQSNIVCRLLLEKKKSNTKLP